ncbi:unnamed protein product [Prorocentrum cordatum]|uniref:Uncharacterized protein n=1 Tax=Prorocentrum cordatum TaxID=2364126 RepID=A0ABN9PM56_9DINO|nr:unnamed protein product [Polarella glacialis]
MARPCTGNSISPRPHPWRQVSSRRTGFGHIGDLTDKNIDMMRADSRKHSHSAVSSPPSRSQGQPGLSEDAKLDHKGKMEEDIKLRDAFTDLASTSLSSGTSGPLGSNLPLPPSHLGPAETRTNRRTEFDRQKLKSATKDGLGKEKSTVETLENYTAHICTDIDEKMAMDYKIHAPL